MLSGVDLTKFEDSMSRQFIDDFLERSTSSDLKPVRQLELRWWRTGSGQRVHGLGERCGPPKLPDPKRRPRCVRLEP